MTTAQKIEMLEALGYKVTPKCYLDNPPHGYTITGPHLTDEYIDISQTMPEIMAEIAGEIYRTGLSYGQSW